MLSRKKKIQLNGRDVGKTPMLLPSVSSRINLEVKKTLDIISEIIVFGPLLVSALDCYKKHITSIPFAELVFLDSGGYECQKDQEISDNGFYYCKEKNWTINKYLTVINSWNKDIPTVLISFDHPKIRIPIANQISDANIFFEGKDDFLKEILIKPEKRKSFKIKPENVIKEINSLASFDIIGFAEKDLGNSVFSRMISIATIRKAMDENKIEKPLHIFGSLDTITTPLYYIAGADIFDGLSWLRYFFDKGNTHYLEGYGPKFYGVGVNQNTIGLQSATHNYEYLREMASAMSRFSTSKDFKCLGPNWKLFEKASKDLFETIGGEE